jgi:hypothetical protein
MAKASVAWSGLDGDWHWMTGGSFFIAILIHPESATGGTSLQGLGVQTGASTTPASWFPA